jgi:hypothetical protein
LNGVTLVRQQRCEVEVNGAALEAETRYATGVLRCKKSSSTQPKPSSRSKVKPDLGAGLDDREAS